MGNANRQFGSPRSGSHCLRDVQEDVAVEAVELALFYVLISNTRFQLIGCGERVRSPLSLLAQAFALVATGAQELREEGHQRPKS